MVKEHPYPLKSTGSSIDIRTLVSTETEDSNSDGDIQKHSHYENGKTNRHKAPTYHQNMNYCAILPEITCGF